MKGFFSSMFRKSVFVCTLVVCLAGAALGQAVEDTIFVPLTVDQGFPLQLLLTKKLGFKENETVHATVIEPVYAFDREVIPSGTKVEGKITGFRKAGKWKRVSRMLAGDFTPIRDPQITFHTMILPGGNRIPIETSVEPGMAKIVSSASKAHALMSTVKPSGKERIKNLLWGLAPYHPQYLPLGTRLSAVLLKPVDCGMAAFEKGLLDQIGSQPPTDSIVSVRLVTALDSRTAWPGAPVEAVTTRPIFSSDQRLILPVGSVLRGQVTKVTPARGLHRDGELGLSFTTLAPPGSIRTSVMGPHPVEGSLISVQVTHDMKDLRISENGTAHIVESKKRFIAPVWSFIKAERSIGDSADPFGSALLGAYRGKFLKQMTGGSTGSGFGLPASITGAMVPPVGIGLGFYSAGRSLYSTFLGRGQDIRIPANTEMEIRLVRVGPQESEP